MEGRSKKLLNDVNEAVRDNLQGFVYAHPGLRLATDENIVYRRDLENVKREGKVTLLSGGGSGHEPAMAGYVGPGMLTAAVAGEIFASPPSRVFLNAVRTLGRNNPGGVLIICFNYTGDRLNFGIALDRARSEGIKAEMIVVGEDCAIQSYEKCAGRRGLCGGIVTFKVAGAMAESGRSLQDIYDTLQTFVTSMGTISICLSVCNIPSSGKSFSLGSDEMELGLGVHGEAGVKRLKLLSSRNTVKLMIDHMTESKSSSRLDLKKGERVVIVVNNLGGMSQLEMNILMKDAFEYLSEAVGVIVDQIISGSLMTSLEMAGFSLTVLKSTDQIISYLDGPTAAPAWPKRFTFCQEEAEIIPTLKTEALQFGEVPNGPALGIEGEDRLRSALYAVCHALVEKEVYLNQLDSESGDSDCGRTLRQGAEAILDFLSTGAKLTHPRDVLLHLSEMAESSMGGASGALYGLFLASGSRAFTFDCSYTTWCQALKLGTEAVCKFGGAEPGDRTMVDALAAACDTLSSGSLEHAVKSAETAALNTANMKARAGRASYIDATRLKSPDPGAYAVAVWLNAIHRSLCNDSSLSG